MNGTMLSQNVWIMFLAHHCLPKVTKNSAKKKAKKSSIALYDLTKKSTGLSAFRILAVSEMKIGTENPFAVFCMNVHVVWSERYV